MDPREIGYEVRPGFTWFRTRIAADFPEHGNETLDSLKEREFVCWLSGHYLLKKDSALQSFL
jgi:hypothetical protein